MEKEKENPTYQDNKKINPMGPRGQYDKNEYLNNLEEAIKAEEKNSGYKPSNIKKQEDYGKIFSEKLEKELQKDKEHPYVPYKDMKKNNNNNMRGGYNQNDFLQKLEKEMEKDKENPYIPYEQRKKKDSIPIEQDSNKLFMEKLNKELEKENKK